MKKRIIAVLLALMILSVAAVAEDEIQIDVLDDDAGLVLVEGEEESSESEGLILELGDLELDGEEFEATATYIFLNGEDIVDTQIVRDGETVTMPETPESPEGKVFAGWYVGEKKLFEEEDTEIVAVDPDAPYVYVEATFTEAPYVYVEATFTEAEESVPVEEEPVEEEPVEEEPVEEEPVEEEPTEEEPVEEEPVEEEPVEEEPVEEEPVEEEPVEEEPVEEESTEEEPAEEEPVEEEPVEEEPVEEEPVEEEPVEEEPVEEEPVEEQPVEEDPVEEEPIEEEPVEEEPVEEEPVEEEPVEEEPVEEEPVEEEPVEEQPTEEEPSKEETAEQPVANVLTYTGEAQALVNGDGAWLYSLDGETYGQEIPAAVNAGEYTVYYKAVEADAPQTLTVTIDKADVQFTPPVAATGE